MHDPVNNRNVFAGAFVDRDSQKREDSTWLISAQENGDGRFIAVWGDKCLAAGEPLQAVLLERANVVTASHQDDFVFLGFYRGAPVFAIEVDDDDAKKIGEFGEFHDLRYLGSMLSADDANLAAHARAMVLWHRLQKYCGRCGAMSRTESGGNSRICSSPDCACRMFPRVDPAIIVIVENDDRCLLGRQHSWPEGRYSTIAGFVEPGESLEDAVRREVLEETNVRIGDVFYHSSQPWPFPSSLMLGFRAIATSNDIKLNDGELEDARWFTRKQLRSGFPKLPYRVSIARRLVDEWLNSEQS